MTLEELLTAAAARGGYPTEQAPTDTGISDRPVPWRQPVEGIFCRSQDVRPGGLFVAIKGFTADGHDYIPQAAEQGALAVVSQKPVDAAVPVFQVPDTRKALADLAAAYYGHPSREMTLIGVTGTNGKTSTTYLIESILKAAGARVGVIGTINYRFADQCFDNPVTTPESLDLQAIMARMHQTGMTHVVMEISSHALELHRVRGCEMNVGVFTNLTQDHLDFHKEMTAYWESKKKLFTEILAASMETKLPVAVINAMDPYGRELAHTLPLPVITTGQSGQEDIRALNPVFDLTGIAARIITAQCEMEIQSPLTGRHNLENILNAVGAARALNISEAAIVKGIRDLELVPGRLERINNSHGRFIYVDYAHTPDALEKVLTVLRDLTRQRLICVFGCGGDRDRGKRPQMGAIAARIADVAVVTSDNPRSEDPAAIIEEILSGMTRSALLTAVDYLAGSNAAGHIVEPDRRKAVALSIRGSLPGDTILIAGKGHETYQIIGRQKHHFDDREEARGVLAGLADTVEPSSDVEPTWA